MRCSWENAATKPDVIQMTKTKHKANTNIYEGKMTKKRALDNEAIRADYFPFYVYKDTGSDKLATASVPKPRETEPKVAQVE